MCGLIFGMLLSAIPVGAAASEVVSFPDANLEDAVRVALGKPVGDVTTDDMATLTALVADERGISDLSGLGYAVNLRELHLTSNQISDISHLASLTNLEYLDLDSNQISDISHLAGLENLLLLYLGSNQISNLEPLAGLENLQVLYLGSNQISNLEPLTGLENLLLLYLNSNQISNLEPLAGLTNLRTLGLGNNQISDLEPLAGLTNLWYLDLTSNQISNLGPLASLTNLEYLHLGNNQIRDISPLVANSGIARFDTVTLRYNYLDLTPGSAAMNDIETLNSRGVWVYYEPQNQNNPPTITAVTVLTDPQLPGSTIQVTGTFTDPDPGDTHTATWTWGDGATSEGTVDKATGTVTGSHVYTAPGTYTIILAVMDNAGSSGTGTATITVQTPAEAISSLREQVAELELQKGIGNAFTVKLDQAIAALNSGDRDGARDVLNAFINQMKALKGKKVAAGDADALIAMAQKIIDSI
jgi:Leucine-rich repeat (LRR) protein